MATDSGLWSPSDGRQGSVPRLSPPRRIREQGSDASVDIESLLRSMEEKKRDASLSAQRSIFRVPPTLRRHNGRAYRPDAFSIGLLHHGEERLKAAEGIKLLYAHDLMFREDVSLDVLTLAVSQIADRARSSYAGAEFIKFDARKQIEILVIDGCFLIETFYRNSLRATQVFLDDPFGSTPVLNMLLTHDLLLLENQMPWFVLERLFLLIYPSSSSRVLHDLALGFLELRFSYQEGSLPAIPPRRLSGILHLLDLLRRYVVSEEKKPAFRDFQKCVVQMPSAASLADAGVTFRRGAIKNGLLNVEFHESRGILEILPILMDEFTEPLFRNLICFEQSRWRTGCEGGFTSYAILMDKLINDARDVRILCDSKIIDNWSAPEDVIQLFNRLYQDTAVFAFHYQPECEAIERYCDRRWPRWRAMYIRNYFSTPWAIASQVVAAVLLTLTFLQTLYAMANN